MSIFRNGAVYAVVYILLMLPTYVLPYFGSNSALMAVGSIATGIGLTMQWWMHVWCLLMLILICWLRGAINGRAYLPVFPFLAAVFDMVPGINLIPLIATVLHIIAIILGVMRSAAAATSTTVGATVAGDAALGKKSRIGLGLMIALTVIAIVGSVWSISATTRGGFFKGSRPNDSKTLPQLGTQQKPQATAPLTPMAKTVAIPLPESDGSTSLKNTQGETVLIYPALPKEPQRLVAEVLVDTLNRNHSVGFMGYVKLRKPTPVFSGVAGELSSASLPIGLIARVTKIMETRQAERVEVLGDTTDRCGNVFKAKSVVFPLLGEGETHSSFGFVAGETSIRQPICISGGDNRSRDYPQLKTTGGRWIESTFEVQDDNGGKHFLKFQPPWDDAFDALDGNGFVPWKAARTVSKDKTNVRAGPGTDQRTNEQLMPDVSVETQDAGNDWLLTRQVGKNAKGYVRRDRLVFP